MRLRRYRLTRMPQIFGSSFRSGSPIKNVLSLGTSFFFLFTGYSCSVGLLSTLNIKDGLGVASQSVLYVVFILGSITMPPLFIRAIGLKYTIALSALLYAPYVAANFIPSWYTFIPSAILVGLAAGPLWTAALSYITAMAKRYSVANGKTNAEDTTFLFIGIFYMFLGFSGVLGYLVSFFLLRPQDGHHEKNVTQKMMDVCGVNFCDWLAVDNEVIQHPPVEKVHLLTGFYVACTLVGVLTVMLTLEGMELSEVGIAPREQTSFKQLLTAPLKRFRLPQHWLLLPITVFNGIQESFISGDFTKAYVACSWGVHHIGPCLMSLAVVICLAFPLLGWVVKHVDRAYLVALAGLVHSVTLTLLWMWTPQYPKYVLFIIPATWGLVVAICTSQVKAMYAILFPEDKSVAFAVMATLEATGLMIGFTISSRVCTGPKLWISAILCVVSLTGYGVADFTHRRRRKALETQMKKQEQGTALLYQEAVKSV